MLNLLQLPNRSERERPRGQVMVILALAFIGLASFIGLTVDAGILFVQIGHLRRAVDSASLAAAAQFREGRSLAEMEAAAEEFINLNSLSPGFAEVFVCDISDPTVGNTNPYHDITLCPPDDNSDGVFDDSPFRKFVRVNGEVLVEFSFLPIIGFGSVPIRASAVSETASVDIILAIDTSPSMTYDADCTDGDDDDFDGLTDDCAPNPLGPNGVPDDFYRDPINCNDIDAASGIQGACHPFEEVRAAALALVDRMYFPYDRMSIVTFDANATMQLQLHESDPSALKSAIGNLTVYEFTGCPGWPNPSECTSTNIADALWLGGGEFGVNLREEAVLIFILLSDGGANAATDTFTGNRLCPSSGPSTPTWVEPFCRDEDFEIGDGQFGFDTEDAAVAQGYFVGCPEPNSFDPALTTCSSPGQGAVVFAIGLGDLMTSSDSCDPIAYPGGCEEDQGEELLRYIAAIGDDGDPSTDPCSSTSTGESCGNYYFSPTGAGLMDVFEAIASRIFTRITQ